MPVPAAVELNVAVTALPSVALPVTLLVALQYFEGMLGPYVYISGMVSPLPEANTLDSVPKAIDEDVMAPVLGSFSFPHERIAFVVAEFPARAQVVLCHEFPPGRALAADQQPAYGNQQGQERA